MPIFMVNWISVSFLSLLFILVSSFRGLSGLNNSVTDLGCFSDCYTSGQNYSGIRSVLKDGRICRDWKDTRHAARKDLKANLCTSIYEPRPGCYTPNNNFAYCEVPDCSTKTGCVGIVNKQEEGQSLTIKWSPSPNIVIIFGYVVMLHNADRHCEQAVIQLCNTCGTMNGLDSKLKSLYLSCKSINEETPVKHEATFTGLQKNRNYSIYITPILTSSIVGDIREVMVRTVFLAKPHIPTGVNYQLDSLRNIKFSWQKNVETPTNGPAEGYVAHIINKNDGKKVSAKIKTESVAFSDLEMCTEYCFVLSSYNGAGESDYTKEICTFTLAPKPDVVELAGPPSGYMTSQAINWTYLGSDNCRKRYLVEYRVKFLPPGIPLYLITNDTKVLLTGLTPNVIYTVRVRAEGHMKTLNSENIGDFSAYKEFYTGKLQPNLSYYQQDLDHTNKILNVSWGIENEMKRSIFMYIIQVKNFKKHCMYSIIITWNALKEPWNWNKVKEQYGKSQKKLLDCTTSLNGTMETDQTSFEYLLTSENEFSNLIVQLYGINLMGIHLLKEKNTIIPTTGCFTDCYNDKGLYPGIRSASKKGQVCANWKDTKLSGNKIMKSNICLYAGEPLPWCYHQDGTWDFCDVPECSRLTPVTGCTSLISKEEGLQSVSLRWYPPESLVTIIGYLVLLHNSDHFCEQAVIQLCDTCGNINNLGNLYLSCKSKKQVSSLNEAYFTGLRQNRNYNVYIAPILTSSSVGHIRNVTVRTTLANPHVPNGVSYQFVAVHKITFSWPRNEETQTNGLPEGYLAHLTNKNTGKKILRRISTESVTFDDLEMCTEYCFVLSSYNKVGESGYTKELCTFTLAPKPGKSELADPPSGYMRNISLTWTYLGSDKCQKRYLVEYRVKFLPEGPLLSFTNNVSVLLTSLRPNVLYTVRVRAEGLMKTLNNESIGDFSALKEFYTGKTQPKLLYYQQNLDNTNHILNISWGIEKEMQESIFMYIIKVKSFTSQCIYSVLLTCETCTEPWNRGNVEDQYGESLKNLIDCSTSLNGTFDANETSFNYLLTSEKGFTNYLLEMYGVNLMGIHTLNEKSSSSPTLGCFTDCYNDKGLYPGIRSASRQGQVCTSWKDTNQSENITMKSNICAYTGVARPWCYHHNGTWDYCDVPECSTITPVMTCVDLIYKQEDVQSVSIGWSPPSSLVTIIGYLVLLHNSDHFCEQALIQLCDTCGNISDLGSFYSSCKSINRVHSMTYKANFTGLIQNRNYNVYIAPIITSSSVGEIRNETVRTQLAKPHIPIGINYQGSMIRKMKFDWQKNVETEMNGPAEGYVAYITNKKTGRKVSKILKTESVEFSDLEMCTEYCFVLSSYNRAGESGYTMEICSFTLAPKPERSKLADPISGYMRSQSLRWTYMGSDTCRKIYLVEYRVKFLPDGPLHSITDSTNVLLTGLKPNVIYTVRMRAEGQMRTVNNANIGEFSFSKEFYTGKLQPNLSYYQQNLDYNNKTLNVSWGIEQEMKGSIFMYIIQVKNSTDFCLYSVLLACQTCRDPWSWNNIGDQHLESFNKLTNCTSSLNATLDTNQTSFNYILNFEKKFINFSVEMYGVNLMGIQKLQDKITVSPTRGNIFPVFILYLVIIGVIPILLFFVCIWIGLIFRKKSVKSEELILMKRMKKLEKLKNKIVISAFPAYYGRVTKHGSADLLKQYKQLTNASKDQEITMGLTFSVGKDSANMKKNGIKNILPYDQNRVKVGNKGAPLDYINASYIPRMRDETHNEYIVAQGPIKNSLDIFWEMIWEQNIHCIVMLTRSEETDKVKGLQYWPSNADQSVAYGNNSHFNVTLVKEEINEACIERELSVENTMSKESRQVIQLHMHTWSDQTESNMNLFDKFYSRFRDIAKDDTLTPYLVHCSDGVGLSGTFICLDRIIKQLDGGSQEIGIFSTVLKMREYRNFMVERPTQYVFIHKYINHFLVKNMRIENVNDQEHEC